MSIAAFLHTAAITVWVGVIAVEIVIEKSSIGTENIAQLHRLADRVVEMPIALLVLVSGVVLWSQAAWSSELLPKVLVGSGAIAVSLYCYICVEKRDVGKGNFGKLTKRMDQSSLIGFACFIAALYLGIRHAG
jgi:predicted ferric reductase